MAIDAKNLTRELRKIITEAAKRETVKAITDSTQRNIEERTRKGKGVVANGQPAKSLPELEKSTVRIRKDLRKKGRLNGEGAAPSKSNLTRSGKLLKSMRTKSKKGEGEIFYRDEESQEKIQKLERVRNKRGGVKNFSFFYVSLEESKDIVRTIRKVVDRAIRKFNNK